MTRAPERLPTISSMYTYLNQNCSMRGISVTARSHTLRAALMCRLRISISAYFSQSVVLRWSTSSARSYTERARSKSRWASSKDPYLSHVPIAFRLMRSRSSKCFRSRMRYTASSSGSVIFCFGAM